MKTSIYIPLLILGLGCGSCDDSPGTAPEPETCRPLGAQNLCQQGDELACRWAVLVEANVDGASMAPLVGLTPSATHDEILVALFPDLDGVALFSGAPTDATEVTLDIKEPYAPVTVSLPVDWTMNPYEDPSWALFFQSLSWFDDIAPALAGQILIHWADEMLTAEDPSYYVWNDHAVSLRIHHVDKMVAAYLGSGEPVSRDVLWAAARLIMTHLYALATERCYKPFHNHGVMQDRALLRTLLRHPSLVDADLLWTLAGERLSEQVHASVTDEGVHVENSPAYHLLFLRLLQEIIGLFGDGGRAVPESFAGVRPMMSTALVYLLQPNMTFPQLGDTENHDLRQELLDDVTIFRAAGADDEGMRYLEWVASDGQLGEMPPELDRVWAASGYAAFRSSWSEHENAITGHFTCGKLSDTHYQKDETGISLYGYGQELVVDPGLLSYRGDSLSLFARSGPAHNALMIDDTEHDGSGEVAITDWGGEGSTLAWVRGGHSHYAPLGVQSLSRTFAHAKPDIFLVVDHLRAEAAHSLTQSFLLHPSMGVISQPTPSTVVASSDIPGAPAVVFSALAPVTIETHRGVSGEPPLGWYFPEFNVSEEATVIRFRVDFAGGQVDLPLLIHIIAPGGSTDSGLDSFERTDQELRLRWHTASGAGNADIPAPEQ